MSIYADLVSYFGTQTKTAEALGVTQGTVSGWVTGAHAMGASVALRAERVTCGKFLARDLSPELRDLPDAVSPAA